MMNTLTARPAPRAANNSLRPDGVNYRSNRRTRSMSDVDDLRKFLHTLGQKCDRPRRIVRAIYVANENWKSVWSKCAVVIYMTYIWMKAYYDCGSVMEFFKYLTHWAWTLELVYFAYALKLDLCSRFTGGRPLDSIVSRTFCHALSELSFALQVVVVLFFWSVIYPEEGWRKVHWEIQIHGAGLLFIMLDYLYRFAGFSVRNHVYILGFSLFYTILHVTFVFLTGEAIYPGIDFRSFYSFAIFLLGTSTLVYLHKGVYLLTHWAYVKHEAAAFSERSHLMFPALDHVGDDSLGAIPRRITHGLSSLKQALVVPCRRGSFSGNWGMASPCNRDARGVAGSSSKTK